MRVVGFRTKLTSEHLALMRIPRRFWEARFETLQDPLRAPVKAYLGSQPSDLMQKLDRGEGLWLSGRNGIGKTTAAVVLAKEVRRTGAPVLFVAAHELCEGAVKKARFNDEMLLSERAETVDFLVLDDLGKEHLGSSGFTHQFLENLLRKRVNAGQATLVTSNIRPEELRKRYHTSFVEFVKELGACVSVTDAKDLRNEIQRDMRRELGVA
jgi:DNA replication protein DnaC